MAFVADMTPKSCFMSCPSWQVKAGNCACHNRSKAELFTDVLPSVDEIMNRDIDGKMSLKEEKYIPSRYY